MWRSLVALLVLSAPQVWAQENATAYEALRVVGRELGRGGLELADLHIGGLKLEQGHQLIAHSGLLPSFHFNRVGPPGFEPGTHRL